MKKITITVGSDESTFTTMVDDTTATKVFRDTVSSLLNSSMVDEPKKETKKHDVVDKSVNHDAVDKSVKHDAVDKSVKHDAVDKSVNHDKEPTVDVIVDNGRVNIPPVGYPAVPISRSRVERLFGTEYGNKPTNYTPYKEIDKNRAYLCFYRCTECNKSFFKMAKHEEKGTCSCGKEFMYTEFTNALYECDCCGFRGIFKVIGDTKPTEINCKGCSSPIDMKYNDDKHKWQSLNMFR